MHGEDYLMHLFLASFDIIIFYFLSPGAHLAGHLAPTWLPFPAPHVLPGLGGGLSQSFSR